VEAAFERGAGFMDTALPGQCCQLILYAPMLSLIVTLNRPEHETDHSPPSSAEVKDAWSYTSTLPIRLHDVVLN
jgi:hypothetical protein